MRAWKQELPVVTLEELVSTTGHFSVFRSLRHDAVLTIYELAVLNCLASSRRPRKVLEWGTYGGLTTVNIIANAPEAEVHTVDTSPKNNAAISGDRNYAYVDMAYTRRILQHVYDPEKFTATVIGRGTTFCLVNSTGSEEELRQATTRVLPLVKHPGLILWHVRGGSLGGDLTGLHHFVQQTASARVSLIQGTAFAVFPVTRETIPALSGSLDIYIPGELTA